MKLDETRTVPLLECRFCKEKYSEDDVRRLLYFPDTQVCANCYKQGQEQKYQEWCFGKPDLKAGQKILAYGYDETSPDCSQACPDRRYCPLFLSGQIFKLQKEANTMATEEVVAVPEKVTKPKTEKKAVTKAKEAEKPKAKAAEEKKTPAPKKEKAEEGTPQSKGNPFRQGSPISELFEMMVAGVPAKGGLEEAAKKLGMNTGNARSRLAGAGRTGYRGHFFTLTTEGKTEKLLVKR